MLYLPDQVFREWLSFRVSGKDTSKVIKLLTGEDLPKPRVATLTKFNNINTSELIDEAILIWFPGPNSYTGEDMAEFHVHGSSAVIKTIQNSPFLKLENCQIGRTWRVYKDCLSKWKNKS